jgi:hypothetical protein
VRTRCRPVTTAHNEVFSFYQIGFRCCADAPSSAAAKPAPAAQPPQAAGWVAPPKPVVAPGAAANVAGS